MAIVNKKKIWVSLLFLFFKYTKRPIMKGVKIAIKAESSVMLI